MQNESLSPDSQSNLELGIQPIDAKMQEAGLTNHQIVAASREQITHKMVSKARRGRRLSPAVQDKILRAFNQASGQNCTRKDLFLY